MQCSIAARLELGAHGDPALGEWTEWTGYAYHIRRRLTAVEQQHVGPAVDVRNTPEAEARAARLLAAIPPSRRQQLAIAAAEELTQ